MSTLEKNVLFQQQKDNDNNIIYPITKTENILDLDLYMNGYRNYKHFFNVHQVIDKTTYTVETTFLDILKQMPSLSVLRYVTSDTTTTSALCTNEIYSITGNKYNLVEIVKHDGASEYIKVYYRESNDIQSGYFFAKSRSNENTISKFTFIGKTKWNLLTPANGWTNYSNSSLGHPPIQWRRENDNIRLKGLAKFPQDTVSNATIIATLPEQARPINTKLNVCVTRYNQPSVTSGSIDTYSRVDINLDGTIMFMPQPASTPGNVTTVSWVSFDNITYSLD